MPHCRFLVAAVALCAALATPVAAQQPQTGDGDNPADKAFIGAMHDMMVGMHRNMPTGDTDADFVRMMLPHHQAAVDMAKAEIRYGKDEGLKTLARDIVAAQEKEIAMMKAWEDRQRAASH